MRATAFSALISAVWRSASWVSIWVGVCSVSGWAVVVVMRTTLRAL